MKIKTIIIFLLTVCWVAFSFAQKKALLSHPYHSNIKKGTVVQFLEELNTRSGIVIEYASNSVDVNRLVELDGTETSVGAVLQRVLKGQYTKLLERNNKLILVKSVSVINTDELVPVYIFYGFVKEDNSKEPMIGASVIEQISHTGVSTNSYGFFSVSLPEGKHRIEVSHVGFNPNIFEVTLTKNTRADIELSVKKETEVMQTIVVPLNDGIKRGSGDKINSGRGNTYNYLLGENDPLRDAYLLPGVTNIPASFTGLFVRGGDPGENLFLMDGNVIYNPSHMLGALSIVNQTSMKSMQLYKSDFPSKYSGAASSVIDIYTKDGNMEHWQGEVNAGTLSGSFTVEGPIVKNKTAIMTSYRHSWISPLYTLFQKGIKPHFYDFHFKATQLLNKNNKLMLNFYNGQDELRQSVTNTDNLHKWGNLTGSLVWNSVIGSRSFINTSVNMSRYKNLGAYKYTLYDEGDTDDDVDDIELESGSVGTFSSTEQYNIKSNAELYLNRKTKLNFGAQFTHTIIKPFESKFSEEIEDDESSFTSFTPLPFDELSVYGEGELRIGKKLFVRPGLHFSVYQFEDYRFYSFQPRFFASYKIANYHRLFASYDRMTQYLHLVTNPYLSMNADLWVPSTDKLQPEQSDLYNLGYEFNNAKGWKISVEGYWKTLQHVTNYVEGKSYFVNNENWEQNVSSGEGWAYGMELMLRKTSGKLSLLATYTLSWSWRRFQDINAGEKFPYKYDRRHSLHAGVGYNLTKNFDLSALWSYSTGDVFSLPDYIYPDFDNAQQIINPNDLLKDYRFVYHYSKYNQYRTSPYHSLDGALSYHSIKNKKRQLIITAGVYNIYGSADQYVYEMKGSINNKSMMAESGYKTFGMTPYLSVTFKF